MPGVTRAPPAPISTLPPEEKAWSMAVLIGTVTTDAGSCSLLYSEVSRMTLATFGSRVTRGSSAICAVKRKALG
jgi:hypothetical protein